MRSLPSVRSTIVPSVLVTLGLLAVPAHPQSNTNATGAEAEPARSTPRSSTAKIPDGLNASDWSSIRAAYEAGRHAAFPTKDGFEARNPGQAWVTRFDRRGFTTHPDEGGWTWGLELESSGFAGSEVEVCEPRAVGADGERVTYQWDDILEEWWVNDMRGLEHGYTVHRRPADDDDHLMLTLAVQGTLDLAPESGSTFTVRIQDSGGRTWQGRSTRRSRSFRSCERLRSRLRRARRSAPLARRSR